VGAPGYHRQHVCARPWHGPQSGFCELRDPHPSPHALLFTLRLVPGAGLATPSGPGAPVSASFLFRVLREPECRDLGPLGHRLWGPGAAEGQGVGHSQGLIFTRAKCPHAPVCQAVETLAIPCLYALMQTLSRYSVAEAASAVAGAEVFARGGTGDVYRTFLRGRPVAIKLVA
jgi:hypothetical protein